MLACGGAVLASTAGAVAETAGAAAHLIDALDVDGWRDAMRRGTEDDDWWGALRAGAVAAARPFTSGRCAAETLAVYPRLAGGAPRARRLPEFRSPAFPLSPHPPHSPHFPQHPPF